MASTILAILAAGATIVLGIALDCVIATGGHILNTCAPLPLWTAGSQQPADTIGSGMTDHEFLRRFESADLETFRHGDHVRVAWIYLERDGRTNALPAMLDGIRRFAVAKGAPGKFHYTLTRAWLDLIDLARRQHPEARSADALIAACPLLGDSRAVSRFYSQAALDSDEARSGWIEPDLDPLDVSPVSIPQS